MAGAPGFPHPGRRRILSLRYLSPDARHAPRSWRTSPPFDGLPAQLPARYRYLVPLADPIVGKLMTLTLFRASSPAAADPAGRARAAGAG